MTLKSPAATSAAALAGPMLWVCGAGRASTRSEPTPALTSSRNRGAYRERFSIPADYRFFPYMRTKISPMTKMMPTVISQAPAKLCIAVGILAASVSIILLLPSNRRAAGSRCHDTS